MIESTIMQAYMREVKRHKILTHAEIIACYQEIDDSNCSESRKKIIYNNIVNANLRLVLRVVQKYKSVITGMSSSISLLDLIQEGSLGLMEGVKRFDYKRGYKIGTYVTWWIKKAITRHLTGADDRGSIRLVRLPAYIVAIKQQINAIKNAENELICNGHEIIPLTNDEIAHQLGVDVDIINSTINASGRQCAIIHTANDMTTQRQGGTINISSLDHATATDNAPDGLFDIERHVLTDEVITSLKKAFRTLSAREEQVLRLRFGIDAEQNLVTPSIIEVEKQQTA